jgi:hypothetical protein
VRNGEMRGWLIKHPTHCVGANTITFDLKEVWSDSEEAGSGNEKIVKSRL